MKRKKRVGMRSRVGMSFVLLCVTGWVNQLPAKMRWVTSERKFYDKIDDEELTVALFYREDREVKRSPAMKSQVEKLKKVFKSVADSYEFKQAEVEFLGVNVAKEKASILPDNFNITQLPAFILFKDGDVVKKEGETVRLVGFTSRDNLVNFIKEHFGDRIKAIIEVKEKIRKERALERAYYWPYGGFGWGYPYFGGFGYGYPYYGGYYRPYWGLGFYGGGWGW